MSEHDVPPSGQPDPTAAPSEASVSPAAKGEPTAGALLREAREAQGLHIAALAAALKVPTDKLEALEQDRFDVFVDAVFMRALASGLCRLLKLDPNPVLQRLPQQVVPRVVPQNRGINEPFHMHSDPGSSIRTQLSRPVIWGGFALLLGAVALVFMPVMQQNPAGKSTGKEVSSSMPAASEPVSATTPSTVQESVPNPASVPAGGFRLPGVVLPPLGASVASAPVLAQPIPAGVNPASVAVFSAKDASWVKVTDAKGVVVLNRTLQAGEVAGVSGLLPLRAVIGRADAVQVQVRGQAFDVNAVAKNNVARFEVK